MAKAKVSIKTLRSCLTASEKVVKLCQLDGVRGVSARINVACHTFLGNEQREAQGA